MIAERALHEMAMEVIFAAQHARPMPSFDHLPYFRFIGPEQLTRLNKAYD